MRDEVRPDARAAFAVALTVAIAGVLIDDATLGWLLAPVVLGAAAFAVLRAPLRHTLYVLMFLAFVLENPEEVPAAGRWKSPLFRLGALMLTHLNTVTHISFLSFSGMDLMLILAGVVAYQRNASERVGRIPTPRVLIRLSYLSLAGTAYVWLYGILTGGDFAVSLWQVYRVMYLPLLFLLFERGLRGPRDYRALARVVVAAALVRSCLAIYIYNTVSVPPDQNGDTHLPYSTSHHDSMLFAAAFTLVTAVVVLKARPKAWRIALLTLPVLALGMQANGRRMVWVQVALVFVTLYLSMRPNPAKRKIGTALLALSPLIVAYLVVGWHSHAGLFKPVQTIRSVVEPSSDLSSQLREIENYDIVSTIREHAIFGSGYGHPYNQVIPLLEMGYPLEPYCPHNSLLGLLCYAGYIGFTAMTLLWAGGVYFAMRGYHLATRPADRVAALMSFGTVLIYLIQCWGDMGLGSWTGVYLMAPALAMSGKIGVGGSDELRERSPDAERARTTSSVKPLGEAAPV